MMSEINMNLFIILNNWLKFVKDNFLFLFIISILLVIVFEPFLDKISEKVLYFIIKKKYKEGE